MSSYRYAQQPPAGYGYPEDYERSSRDPPREPPRESYATPSAPAPSGPNFRWWIPNEGIRRDVIQADIQRYLGPDAVVRPGEGRDENRGRNGYWIAAYRTFTPEMIRDLKADSANFERSGDRGPYQDSMIHRSRQHWGPTEPAERVQSSASNSTIHSQQSTGSYPSSQGYQPPTYAPAQTGYDPTRGGSTNNYTYEPRVDSSFNGSSGTSHPGGVPRHMQDFSQPQNPPNPAYASRSNPAPAPPGYYLASDGNYYPESSRPAQPHAQR